MKKQNKKNWMERFVENRMKTLMEREMEDPYVQNYMDWVKTLMKES